VRVDQGRILRARQLNKQGNPGTSTRQSQRSEDGAARAGWQNGKGGNAGFNVPAQPRAFDAAYRSEMRDRDRGLVKRTSDPRSLVFSRPILPLGPYHERPRSKTPLEIPNVEVTTSHRGPTRFENPTLNRL
jgi:hypothetical protein